MRSTQRPTSPRVPAAGSRNLILARLVVIGVGCGAGCGDNRVPQDNPTQRLDLVPVQVNVSLKPGATAAVAFRLTTAGGIGPVPGERLDFAAVDDPSTPQNDPGGATLSASSALTDADGIGTVSVTGGQQTVFLLTARNPRALTASAVVVVGNGDEGTIAVVAESATGPGVPTSAITTVALTLFDSRRCSDLSAITPPASVRPTLTVAPGKPAEFKVNAPENAVVGQGRDGDGKLRAIGCVDVPGSTVMGGITVRVYLPLSPLIPHPSGAYLLASRFSLARRDLAPKMAAPWQDLGDCPLDPGQLWLDCALDAMSSPPGDALDCVPAPTGEGALADLVGARRGGASTGAPCRAATLAGGAQSLDAKVAALFPSPSQPPTSAGQPPASAGQPPASDVESLAQSLATILDDITIGSTLSLEATATPGVFQAAHALRTATFQVGPQPQPTTVDIVAEGVPSAAVRFVSATTMGNMLAIGTHNLGLRLGTLAHAAFAKTALVGRGLPAGTGPYLDVLFGSATTAPGPTHKTGCDALDALVCADVGVAAGCLRAACVAGQAALATRLDAGFVLADGDGSDLQLSGSAGMVDSDGDGVVDQLGTSADGAGLWTAQIRAHAGTEIVSGSWTGAPQPP